jgi:hypothetical protein
VPGCPYGSSRDDGIKPYREACEFLRFNPPISACCGSLAATAPTPLKNIKTHTKIGER